MGKGLTRADIARELSVSKDTVTKYAIELGLVDGKNTRKVVRFDNNQSGLLISEIVRRKRGDYRKPCGFCGLSGHISSMCPTTMNYVKKCSMCLKTKAGTEFHPIKDKSRPNKIRASIYCRECESSLCRSRYRTLEGRAGALARSASTRGKETITGADVLKLYEQQNGLCYYTGQKMSSTGGNEAFSLDRVDSSKPYTVDNLVLCCWVVNQMKREHSFEYFMDLCKKIVAQHG